MDVLILAGGLGTRISSQYKDVPKSLIEINNKPFIYWQLNQIINNKKNRVIICTGYLSDKIEKYVSNNFSSKLEIFFSKDGNKKLGTGGAILNALPLIKSKDFIVIYGDSYLIYEYKVIIDHYILSKYKAMNVIYKNNNLYDKSNINIFNGKIISIFEKNYNKDCEYIDWGMSIFNKKIFIGLKDKVFDLTSLKKQLILKKKLNYFLVNQRFYEIGSLKGIVELNFFMKKNKKNI